MPSPSPRSLLLAVLCLSPICARAQSFFIDFGSDRVGFLTTAEGWNNVGPRTTSLPLADGSGQLTTVTLTITSPFHVGGSGNTDGTPSPDGLALAYEASATRDSLFGHTGSFRGEEKRTPVLTFSGLDPQRLYSFAYFASRVGAPVRDRTTDYVLNNGAVTDVKSVDAQNNLTRVAVSAQLAPSPEGTITLSLVPGRTNSTTEGFTYLGVLEIEGVPALRRLAVDGAAR